MITDFVNKAYARELIKTGRRADGRGLLNYRQAKVEVDYIPNAEGSALASLGETKVVAGVKLDLVAPFPDRPDEAVISFNSEFSPIAHPDFEAGPPNENSIELARVVDRGIRSAEVIDLKKLGQQKTPEGKVLGVYVDLYIIDQCGNLIDCAALAAMAALCNTRVPKFDGEKLDRANSVGNLPLQRKVIACSFEKIEGQIVLDASYEEETASEGRFTVSVTDEGKVCAVQKSGAAGFTREQVLQFIDIAFEKGGELLKQI